MPKAVVRDVKGEELGEIELPDFLFGADPDRGLLHSAIRMYRDRRRRGTASTKTRSEVRGGGRKPWRQKGTGWARHGSNRSPLWKKGGVALGPRPRSYAWQLPKKVRRAALRSALSDKVSSGGLIVVEGLNMEVPKTSEIARALRSVGAARSCLIVTAGPDVAIWKSARNIPGVSVIPFGDLNAYDVVAHETLVLCRDALAALEGSAGDGAPPETAGETAVEGGAAT